MDHESSLSEIIQQAREKFRKDIEPVLAPLSQVTASFGLEEQFAEMQRLASDHVASTFNRLLKKSALGPV